jgi:hypothetical protein
VSERRTSIERDVRPVGPYRLPPGGRDGLLRRREGVFWRLLHDDEGRPVVVRAWPVAGAVRFRAEAFDEASAEWGIERMRFAFGVDHSLAGFHQAFKRDPLLGPIIRRAPWARPQRRPEPFEALAWAITEQLIATERAEQIQRRIIWRFGRRGEDGLRDAPTPAALAARAPAEFCALDLAPWSNLRAPSLRAGWTSPSTSAPGTGCSASATSAPGRSRSWPFTARAATTCCPPGTSRT